MTTGDRVAPGGVDPTDALLYADDRVMDYAFDNYSREMQRREHAETRVHLYVGLSALLAGAQYLLLTDILPRWSFVSCLLRLLFYGAAGVSTIGFLSSVRFLIDALIARRYRYPIIGDAVREFAHELRKHDYTEVEVKFYVRDLIFKEYTDVARHNEPITKRRMNALQWVLYSLLAVILGTLLFAVISGILKLNKERPYNGRQQQARAADASSSSGTESTAPSDSGSAPAPGAARSRRGVSSRKNADSARTEEKVAAPKSRRQP